MLQQNGVSLHYGEAYAIVIALLNTLGPRSHLYLPLYYGCAEPIWLLNIILMQVFTEWGCYVVGNGLSRGCAIQSA